MDHSIGRTMGLSCWALGSQQQKPEKKAPPNLFPRPTSYSDRRIYEKDIKYQMVASILRVESYLADAPLPDEAVISYLSSGIAHLVMLR